MLAFMVERAIPAGWTWAYEGNTDATTYGTWEKLSVRQDVL